MKPRHLSPFVLRRRSALLLHTGLLVFGVLAAPGVTRPTEDVRRGGENMISFEENLGQAGANAAFIARGPAYYFSLSPTEATVSLRKLEAPRSATVRPQGRTSSPVSFRSVRLEFVGANPDAAISGEGELPGRVNYFVGSDPARWRSGASMFGRVRVAGIYPGINLVHYGNQQHLEYDFEVAPGADPSVIAIRFSGADRLHLTPQGDLVLRLGADEIRQPKPVVYQNVGPARKEISGAYVLTDEQTVTFALGEYDRRLPLVIDPVLTYSTYYGGTGRDAAWGVAVDAAGFIYVAGETMAGLPITSGTLTNVYGGAGTGLHGDAFVAKFDSTFSNVIYRSYVGGAYDDVALSLAVDSEGSAFITGYTDSADFPRANAIFTNISGTPYPVVNIYPLDAFVTKLGPWGTNLVYSTFLGGNGTDVGLGIAVDPAGNAYVAGYTQSTNFPTANVSGQFTNYNGGYEWDEDAFVTKLGPQGTNLVYSMFLGGTNVEHANDIAADAAGVAYVTGFTTSTNFPVSDAVQPRLAGAADVFVTAVGATGNILRSTYLGGAGTNEAHRIALDDDGNVYLTGVTVDDPNFPTTAGLNAGGSFRTTDGGAVWSAASAGLYSVLVASLAVDPENSSRVYAGTGHGIARSTDAGATWQTGITVTQPSSLQGLAPEIAVGTVYSLAIDPLTPATVYAGTGRGIFNSPDAGVSWTLSSSNLSSSLIRTLAVNPASPAILYAGGDFGVYRSTNSAVNWQAFNNGLNTSVRAVVVHPTIPTTLYAATAGGVFRSTTSGTNWSSFNSGLANTSVQALAIDATTPTTLYAGTAAGVFKSSNGGTNWTAASVGLVTSNVTALVVSPPSTLYAGTTNGLFKSQDAGVTWTRQTNSFSVSSFLTLALDPQLPARVYAGTRGTNVYGGRDVFVTKLGANGFSAVFGGSGNDEGWDVAVDATGRVHVVGSSSSTNLPTRATSGFLRANNSGGRDAFVAEIAAAGSSLLSCVYFGGAADEWAFGVARDGAGNTYVVGETSSSDLPMRGALQGTYRGSRDAFIARLAPSVANPVLSIQLLGNRPLLSWSAQAADYHLQASTNLALPAGWVNVSGIPVETNGVLSLLAAPATNAARFFRLANP